MANINNDIRTGFFNKLLTGTALKAAIAQVSSGTTFYKLYYHEAPQELPGTSASAVLPYVVMDILPIDPARDSATKWYTATVQFIVASLILTECETIAGLLTDLLEDAEASITIGTYAMIQIMRGPQIYLGKIEGVENIAVQYSIMIQQ